MSWKKTPIDETIRVQMDVSFKDKELILIKELVKGAKSFAPIISDLGSLSRLVLTGAGALVAMWGLSCFCKAVVLPFYDHDTDNSGNNNSSSQRKEA